MFSVWHGNGLWLDVTRSSIATTRPLGLNVSASKSSNPDAYEHPSLRLLCQHRPTDTIPMSDEPHSSQVDLKPPGAAEDENKHLQVQRLNEGVFLMQHDSMYEGKWVRAKRCREGRETAAAHGKHMSTWREKRWDIWIYRGERTGDESEEMQAGRDVRGAAWPT